MPAAPIDTTKALPVDERPVRIRSVHRVDSGDNSVPYISTGDGLTIEVTFEALRPVEDVVFSLEILAENGSKVVRTDTQSSGW